MRIIQAEEVYALATPRRAMEAVERAFLAAAGGELTDSSSLALAIPDASFHVKSCASLRGGLGRIWGAAALRYRCGQGGGAGREGARFCRRRSSRDDHPARGDAG